jgi:hypothetical protein
MIQKVNASRSTHKREAKVMSFTPFMHKGEMSFSTKLFVSLEEGLSLRHSETMYPSSVFRRYMPLWGWKRLSRKRFELIVESAPKTLTIVPLWSSKEEGLIYSLKLSEESMGDWLEAVDSKAYKYV